MDKVYCLVCDRGFKESGFESSCEIVNVFRNEKDAQDCLAQMLDIQKSFEKRELDTGVIVKYHISEQPLY